MKKLVENTKHKNIKANYDFSKKRLIDNLTKKFNTTMIGSISLMEREFGELWGHGKTEEECNREEKYWRKKWNILRTELLNNGNNQLRASINEVGEYTMKWEKYSMTFFPVSTTHKDIVS